MAGESLAPYLTKSSAAMVLTMENKQVLHSMSVEKWYKYIFLFY